MAFLVFLCFTLCVPVLGQISVNRLCADHECKEPISEAEAHMNYIADRDWKLTLKVGDVVKVLSKDADSVKGLWEVEASNKRGFVPASLLRETKVIITRKELIMVPGKSKSEMDLKNSEKESVATLPDTGVSDTEYVNESFAVVAGTTIYHDASDSTVETQPMETAFPDSRVHDTVPFHYAKTIDATSISSNKLDEPNDSLVIPQPTTSNDENYRESSQTQTHKSAESSEDERDSVSAEAGSADAEKLENVADKEDNEKAANKEVEDEGKVDEGGRLGSEEEDYVDDEYEEVELEDDEESERDRDNSLEEVRNDNIPIVSNVAADENTLEDQTVISESSTTSPLPDSSGYNFGNNGLFSDNTVTEKVEEADKDTSEQEVVHSALPQPSHKEEITENNGDELATTETPNSAVAEHNLNMSKHELEASVESNVDFEEESANQSISENEHPSFPEGSVHVGESEDNSATAGSEEDAYINSASDEALKQQESSGGTNVLSEEEEEALEVQSGKGTSDPVVIEEHDSRSQELPLSEEPSAVSSDEKHQIEDLPVIETSDEVTSTESIDLGDAEPHQPKETPEETSAGTFSTLLDFILSGYKSVFGSRETETTVDSMPVNGVSSSPEEVLGACESPGTDCGPELGSLPSQSSRTVQAEWYTDQEFDRPEVQMDLQKTSFDTFLYLMVTAVTVLIFSLGHYYIEKLRRDGSLIAKINALEKALMVSSQEKFELRDELERLAANGQSNGDATTISVLQNEISEYKANRIEMEEQILALEKELHDATEAGLELNRMMCELLSAQDASNNVKERVEHLQKQLDSQQGTISTMNARLTAKNLENENLKTELTLASEKIHNLEEQLEKGKHSLANLDKEKLELEQNLLVKNQAIEQKLLEALESKSADSQRLCKELDALQDVLDETRKTLAARDGEVTVLRDCLHHAQTLDEGDNPPVSLDALLNVGQLRANIELLTKERDELKERLQGEDDARKLLEDHVKIVSEEVSTLNAKYEEADRGKVEAQTRLEVLSNYFKEKETQLQKELGLQEAMCIQKEGDALSTVERIKLFQEEIESYKAQNELLKNEIMDQERSMKSQKVTLEKKMHENWVAARHAERRLEESKQEASQLRNRLTLTARGTIPGPDSKKPERDVEHNGEVSSSPALMTEVQEMPSSPLHYGIPASPPLLPPSGQPLPPGPFPGMPPMFLPPGPPGMPPFPLPPPHAGLFPDDLRPPPLGRMSSPPPEPRTSYSPFEHSPPRTPTHRPYRSPIHYDDSPSRYHRQSPPSSGAPSYSNPYSPVKWDDRNGPPRSSFRPLHRDSPRDQKGSTLSSSHSSESLEKGGRHNSRV